MLISIYKWHWLHLHLKSRRMDDYFINATEGASEKLPMKNTKLSNCQNEKYKRKYEKYKREDATKLSKGETSKIETIKKLCHQTYG